MQSGESQRIRAMAERKERSRTASQISVSEDIEKVDFGAMNHSSIMLCGDSNQLLFRIYC
jgi:hypothetical protein